MRSQRTLLPVLTGVFAALICVGTLLIQIPIPATGGYVNPGDGVLLVAAAVLPLPHAVLAAAIGSMLADILTGYLAYAPATLIIKGLMALFAGMLLRRLQGKKWAFAAAGFCAECCMVLGYFVFEALFLGLRWGAAAGIAGNVSQGVMGLLIYIAVAPVLKKRLHK